MLKQYARVFLGLFFPKLCHLCAQSLDGPTGAFDDYLCGPCAQRMRMTSDLSDGLNPEPAPPFQDSAIEFKEDRCRSKDASSIYILSCYQYEKAVRELIHQFKFGQRPYLVKTIDKLCGYAIQGQMENFFQEADFLVPIPLHPIRLREREFNQSELIARLLAQRYGKTVKTVLKKNRHTRAQSQTGRERRFENILGVFEADQTELIKKSKIVIVDDVATTTATLQEAAQTLYRAGAEQVRCFAFAKG